MKPTTPAQVYAALQALGAAREWVTRDALAAACGCSKYNLKQALGTLLGSGAVLTREDGACRLDQTVRA